MVWETLLNKVVKIAYNDTPTSVAIITGKLIKETSDSVTILHNGVENILPNSKIVKIQDYSFMDCIQCKNCGYWNWFEKGKKIKSCQKCGSVSFENEGRYR